LKTPAASAQCGDYFLPLLWEQMSTVGVQSKGLSDPFSVALVAAQLAFVHRHANPLGSKFMPGTMAVVPIDNAAHLINLDRHLNTVCGDVGL
jgi:hypothetical protein